MSRILEALHLICIRPSYAKPSVLSEPVPSWRSVIQGVMEVLCEKHLRIIIDISLVSVYTAQGQRATESSQKS